MTQEEKAKVYTELINRLEDVKNAIKKQNYGIAMNILCKPYPKYQITTSTELKESEDERMIQYFKDLAPFDKADELYEKYGFSHNDAISWLEKQGEHANFLSKIQVGDKVTRNEDGVLVNLSQLKRIAKPAEEYNITGIGSKNAQGKLGEMIKNLKPTDKVESKFKKGDVIRRKDGDGLEWTVENVHKDGYCTIVNSDRDDFILLDDKWELVEQKTADKVEPKFKKE